MSILSLQELLLDYIDALAKEIDASRNDPDMLVELVGILALLDIPQVSARACGGVSLVWGDIAGANTVDGAGGARRMVHGLAGAVVRFLLDWRVRARARDWTVVWLAAVQL